MILQMVKEGDEGANCGVSTNQVIKVLKTPLHRLEAKLLDVSGNLTFGLLILD